MEAEVKVTVPVGGLVWTLSNRAIVAEYFMPVVVPDVNGVFEAMTPVASRLVTVAVTAVLAVEILKL